MRPAELYRWVQGSTVWTYTSADEAIDYNGETYTPVPIGRGELEQVEDVNKATLSLRVPRSNPVGMLHLNTFPDNATTFTLFRFDEEGAVTVLWKGRIAAAKTDGNEIEVEHESVFTSLRRTGLRARYQRSCRHPLYSRGCNLNADDFGVEGTASAVNGNTVTVQKAAEQADGWYLAGMLKGPDGELRYVTNHVGDKLTLSREAESVTDAVADSGYGNNYGNYYGSARLMSPRRRPGAKSRCCSVPGTSRARTLFGMGTCEPSRCARRAAKNR